VETRLSDEGPNGADFSHPIYDPVRPALERLAREADWPDEERLNLLAKELGTAPRTAGGRPVRFVAPCPGDANYELRVHASGEVPTRPRNWHDLFNALAWIAFPHTKAMLNARHAAQIPREAGRRGPLRDLLTIFDEGGAIVAFSDPGLVELVRKFRWRELFWQRRARVLEAVRIVVVGHAVLDQARRPRPGITCKVLFVPADESLLRSAPARLMAHLDRGAAQWLRAASDECSPRRLAPLPVFGYPGWYPGNEREAFYGDTRYFRPLRRPVGAVESARESARQPLRASAEESPGSAERDAG
jgi:Protein of unknown function (DUF3025)